MFLKEEDIREESVIAIAKKISVAARTAPKGKGVDNLEIAILTGDDIEKLAVAMCEIAEKEGRTSFARDAENCRKSQAVMLFATKNAPLGLNCFFVVFQNARIKIPRFHVSSMPMI